MATKPSDIPNLEKQISGLQTNAGVYQDKLNSSPTALGGEGTPTTYDIANQESLQRIQGEIQGLTDKKLRTQWYGTDKISNAPEEPSSPGIIGSTLDYLARPLYGIVGATKHVLGQGTGSLQQDIADNMARNKNTFSDVLKSSGVIGGVAAPLGFALDVAMDPVNWLTMGSAALVPRLGMGVYKGVQTGEGALRGLGIAAKSNLLEKANTVGRYTPFLRKTEAYQKLGTSALKATDAWEGLSGITAESLVLKKGLGVGNYRIGLGDVINRVADATPGGQTVLKNFVYDPVDWVRQARIKDIVQDSLGSGIDLKAAVNASVKGESIEPFMAEASRQAAERLKSTPVRPVAIDFGSSTNLVTNKEVDQKMAELAGLGLDKKLEQLAPKMVNGVDDASSIMKNPAPYISSDPMENAMRIANEKVGGDTITMEELAKIVNSGALDESGVRWFDNMMRSVKDFRSSVDGEGAKIAGVGQRVMDTYDRAMGIFRAAKVGASPTSWMNAIVGNTLMTHMANGDLGPDFIRRLSQSWAMYRNKPGAAAFLDDLLMNAGRQMGDENMVRRALGENRSAARGTFGSLDFVNTNYNAERLLRAARDAGIVPPSVKAEDIASDVKTALDELAQVQVSAGTEPVRSLLKKGGDVTRADLGEAGTGMLTNEMFNSRATASMFNHIAERAKTDPSNLAWKLLDFTLNKMPSGYEKIDQTFKMATFLRATVDGYSLGQLRQMRHLIDINPEELSKYAKGGQYLYRLAPKTAIELANVMYLNYNAMPAAVRVMRNFPLLGSPFISFMYGMTLKTGQTLAYNPSAFNKVTFAMNDFGGSKTPLEKKALGTQFYSYLKQPGMFRVPFFDQNPVYLNLANMIPYYSLNMFSPTQTSYGNSLREQIAGTIQQSPIMKDPAGNVLFENFILPLILGEAIRPQGQFGQPLYPVDATAVEKAGYGLRNFGEAFVPNIASYAGLLTPEAAADYIPSYRWRQLSKAKAGKNQLGISGKEPAVSRTVRTLLQASGIPVQAPVNTSFGQGQQ